MADLREIIGRLDGLFVGMLNDDEMEAFERAIDMGIAARSYVGASGFLGLAKVKSRLFQPDQKEKP